MPKRSNEFQKIIYMIQQQLADNAVVSESKMLKDRSTGADVEVDIFIETSTGPINLTVGIECTATSRPATVEWVREIIGKHQGLPINKTILISKSGFTSEAEKKAKTNGIETKTIEEAEAINWDGVVQNLKTLTLESFEFNVIKGVINYNKAELGGAEFHVNPKMRVYREGEEDVIAFSEFINGIIRDKKVTVEVMSKYGATPREGRPNTFEFTVNMIPHNRTQIEVIEGKRCTINSVDIEVRAHVISTPLSMTAGKYMGRNVAFGAAKNIFPVSKDQSQDVIITFVKKDDGSTTSSLSIPKFQGSDTKVFTTTFSDQNNNDPSETKE